MRNERMIQTLYDCAAACNHCADACLDEENLNKMVRCVRLDRICGDTCIATAKALSVNADQDVKGLVQYCKEICDKCAEECEKHEHQHCKDCAKACRECAEACSSF